MQRKRRSAFASGLARVSITPRRGKQLLDEKAAERRALAAESPAQITDHPTCDGQET